MFGTCAGLILTAREVDNPAQFSLGFIDVGVERNAYGRQRESFETRGTAMLDGPAVPVEMVFIRAPRIRRVGEGVEMLARHGDEAVMARQGTVLVATFHPELTDDLDGARVLLSHGAPGPRRVIFHEYYAGRPGRRRHALRGGPGARPAGDGGPDGTPHLGLYPFVHEPGAFELHLIRVDELVIGSRVAAALRVRGRDEVLGVIPSYWVSQEYAGSATAYHRTVIFECEATVIRIPPPSPPSRSGCWRATSPRAGSARSLPSDPLYRAALEQLVALRLTVERTRVKFKLGSEPAAGNPAPHRGCIAHAGRPGDAQAADAVEWTLRSSPAAAGRAFGNLTREKDWGLTSLGERAVSLVGPPDRNPGKPGPRRIESMAALILRGRLPRHLPEEPRRPHRARHRALGPQGRDAGASPSAVTATVRSATASRPRTSPSSPTRKEELEQNTGPLRAQARRRHHLRRRHA